MPIEAAVGAHERKTCESVGTIKSTASMKKGASKLSGSEAESSASSSALPGAALSSRLVKRARKAATMSLENEVDAWLKKSAQSAHCDLFPLQLL